tara:strand:+ start:213 stop:575 length:363 start_codon:yes stop_codon:yes gene_type:complete
MTYWNTQAQFRKDGEERYDCGRKDLCVILDTHPSGGFSRRKDTENCCAEGCSAYHNKIKIRVECCFCNDPGLVFEIDPGGYFGCGDQKTDAQKSDVVSFEHGVLEEKDEYLVIKTAKRNI